MQIRGALIHAAGQFGRCVAEQRIEQQRQRAAVYRTVTTEVKPPEVGGPGDPAVGGPFQMHRHRC